MFRSSAKRSATPAAHGATHGATDGAPHVATHEVTLITRQGCHLCEVAEQTLRRLRDELGYSYGEVDVDGDAGLRDEYSDRVPVVLIDGREHGYWRVEEPRFRAALARPR